MRYLPVFFLGMLLFCSFTYSQLPEKKTSSEIYADLQKLNFLGTALYIAAHPDDENTRLIAYLSKEVKARTAYLSLTRGDGGQNLIGPELTATLGVLRTQELLAARRIDGGEQFFTRAIDFGYSKHPDETLRIWNKEAILGDVVQVIRTLKPDVIINRFDHRSPGSTHGHHTSSAMLGLEAFDLANNPNAYPEQLQSATVWQPKRIFFNTSWWFYGSEENFKKADKSKMINLNVGVYYPLLGVSNNEIAALASSQHLCQGFGRLSTRGSENEYIELLKGDFPEDPTNLFEGINTTWSRIPGGEAIGKILYGIEKDFDFVNPSAHIPQLVAAYQLLQQVPDAHWKAVKSKELQDLLLAVSGLYLEATASGPYTTKNSTLKLNIEAINRSPYAIGLTSIGISPTQVVSQAKLKLAENEKQALELEVIVPERLGFTSPYWLREQGALGIYKVDDKNLIGKPETPPALIATFKLDFNGYPITIEKPVVYRYAEPDKGELYQPFEILPKAVATITEKVHIFATSQPKEIAVKIKTFEDKLTGTLHLDLPENWQATPEKINFTIAQKGDENTFIFKVTPPESESEGKITPKVTINSEVFSQELIEIKYDHIPKQTVLMPSESKVVRLNIKKTGEQIGYVIGAEDQVPQSLEQIGYKVHYINPTTITEGSLDNFDAIVVGIRAYNVVDELKYKQKYLLDYVKNGGNLIVQYTVAARNGVNFEGLAPYELQLSSDRITNENSPVVILAKNHPLVNVPNKISDKDFDGWIQERGLYFPNVWGKEFTPILSMEDEGETSKEGSILVASYGKGNYIYTGISFFRELPEGVSGAYRLFANMLSLGQEK
jgi:LmbE family N-acetylglucosaminyl deacetylase